MTIEPGTIVLISSKVRFGRLYLHAFGTACYFIGIKHVARSVEIDLPISTMSVCLSVCPPVRPYVSK